MGVKTFEYVYGLAAGLAVDIRECRRGLYASRAAQRLSGRSAEPWTPLYQNDVHKLSDAPQKILGGGAVARASPAP